MGKGLYEYDQTNEIFSHTFLPRVFFTGVLTGAWVLFARRGRLFPSSSVVNATVPVAALLSYYLSRGLAYHYVAVEDSNRRWEEEKERNHEGYMNTIRRKFY
jgi:hypothetical protein